MAFLSPDADIFDDVAMFHTAAGHFGRQIPAACRYLSARYAGRGDAARWCRRGHGSRMPSAAHSFNSVSALVLTPTLSPTGEGSIRGLFS